jgi:hypothetical protein
MQMRMLPPAPSTTRWRSGTLEATGSLNGVRVFSDDVAPRAIRGEKHVDK